MLVVGNIGAVGCSHFHQLGPALPHHIRNTKASADLHRLAAGYDNFPFPGQGAEDQEHRGSVIVDYQGILGARELAQQLTDMNLSGTPLPAFEVDLQIIESLRGQLHGSYGVRAKGGSA